PISKAAYLGGRFVGALVVVLGIYTSIGLGLWLGSRMPWLDQTRLGPTRFAAYAMPYVTSIVPNLLFSGAIFFAVAALARRILPIYVVSIVFVVGYIASTQLFADMNNRTLAALIDPFGLSAARALTDYWTASERSTRLIPLSGLI